MKISTQKLRSMILKEMINLEKEEKDNMPVIFVANLITKILDQGGTEYYPFWEIVSHLADYIDVHNAIDMFEEAKLIVEENPLSLPETYDFTPKAFVRVVSEAINFHKEYNTDVYEYK